MEIIFSPKAIKDLTFWKKSGDKSAMRKIQELLESIQITPFSGLGKPEPLKHQLSGLWSRRINKEHRIIYEVLENERDKTVNVLSLKGHYERT